MLTPTHFLLEIDCKCGEFTFTQNAIVEATQETIQQVCETYLAEFYGEGNTDELNKEELTGTYLNGSIIAEIKYHKPIRDSHLQILKKYL